MKYDLQIIMQVIFIVLKLTDQLEWSWFWILSPTWLFLLSGVLFFLLTIAYAFILGTWRAIKEEIE